jgi:hypothetical protein
MSFAKAVLDFHFGLDPSAWRLPRDFDLIYPFSGDDTKAAFEQFYSKYFDDDRERHFLFGINPGRFGAGVTGIPFTDPALLEQVCGIANGFEKRNELSSLFVYEVIEAMGGPAVFYQNYYISSLCPLGFIKDKKNANYYDDPKLYKAVKHKMVSSIRDQLSFGAKRDRAFSMGQGTNYAYFKELNKEYSFFQEIIPLPHPRWVMQYKKRDKAIHIDKYVKELCRK